MQAVDKIRTRVTAGSFAKVRMVPSKVKGGGDIEGTLHAKCAWK